MKWNIKNENKGFTLIELILSVVILAFVVAPFLSSFIVANNNNAASKRKQEATDIGQLLAEEFKATDFRKLTGDEGYSYNPFDVLDEDGTNIGVGYSFILNNEDLPHSYNDAYSAEVTLEPSREPGVAADVNEEKTPKIKNADDEEMAVFLTNFYSMDRLTTGTSAEHRECTITINKRTGSEEYDVRLSVRYCDINGAQVLAKDFNPLSFTDIKPEIYLIYTPMSDNDELIIENNISPINLEDENGEQQKINVYLASQEEGGFHLNPSNVVFKSVDDNGNPSQEQSLDALQNTILIDDEKIYETTTTCIYTNVSPEGKENLVSMTQKDTLYNMKIVVKYNEDIVATINSTKNISDKGDTE